MIILTSNCLLGIPIPTDNSLFREKFQMLSNLVGIQRDIDNSAKTELVIGIGTIFLPS